MDSPSLVTLNGNSNDCDVFLYADAELDTATPEQRLLGSYDHFYNAVNKLTVTELSDDGLAPLPSLQRLLHDIPIPKDRLRDLEQIWKKAKICSQVQTLVKRFHEYRSGLVQRVRQQSSAGNTSKATASSGLSPSTEAQDGIPELIRNQQRMEQQLQFSNTLLVSMEQQREQLPTLMIDLAKKTTREMQPSESSELDSMVHENRNRLERMEQLLMNLEEKFSKWEKSEAGVEFSSKACWPDSIHNNIVYSLSEGVTDSSLPSDDQSSCMTQSEAPTVPLSKGISTPKDDDMPDQSLVDSEQTEAMHQAITVVPVTSDEQPSPPLPHHSTSANSALSSSSSFDNGHDSSTALIHCNNTQTQFIEPSMSEEAAYNSNRSTNRSESSLVDKKLEDNVDGRFDETFLQDALRVQQNILTSDLGSHSRALDVVSGDNNDKHCHSTEMATASKQYLDANKQSSDSILLDVMSKDNVSFLTRSLSCDICTAVEIISPAVPDPEET